MRAWDRCISASCFVLSIFHMQSLGLLALGLCLRLLTPSSAPSLPDAQRQKRWQQAWALCFSNGLTTTVAHSRLPMPMSFGR